MCETIVSSHQIESTHESIPFQGQDSRWFWRIQWVLFLVWFGQSVIEWASRGYLGWMTGLRLLASLICGLLIILALMNQRRHGPPRIEVTDSSVGFKTGLWGPLRWYQATEITRVEITPAKAILHPAGSAQQVSIDLGGYHSVQSAKKALREFATRNGLAITQ